MGDSIFHIVCDHQRGKVITVDDSVCDIKYFRSCFRVKGCGVLIQKEKLRFLKSSHQKGECLSLTAREKSYFGSKTIFKSKIQDLQKLFVFFTFYFGNTRTKNSCFSTSFGKSQIFFDSHGSSSTSHRILEYTAKISSSLVFGKFGNICSVNDDLAFIYWPYTGNRIQHCGFSGTVTADDSNKIPFV